MGSSKITPTRIWPVWVFYGIIFIVGMISGGNPQAVANMLWVAIVLSVIIHLRNKKNFGKKYLKDPKPTKKIIEKSKDISFVPSRKHQIIIYSLTFISFTIALLFGGIYGAVLVGFGVHLLVESIIRLVNKNTKSKVLFALVLGIILILGGVWVSYNSINAGIGDLIERQMNACDAFCAASVDVNQSLYTQYTVEWVEEPRSFVCSCLSDNNQTLAQTTLNLVHGRMG